MNVNLHGAVHWGSQLPRIEQGFIELGHQITPYSHEADLIYANNGPYDQILLDKCAGRIRGKVILTLLDVPLHLGASFDYEKTRAQLAQADAVTVISEYVQWQAKEYLGLDSHVIYNPVKPVYRDPSAQLVNRKRFAHIGRKSDPNKRHALGVHAVQILGYQPSDVYLVGNEPGWGDYCGVLSDENLNRVYNSVDFVLCTSKVEGLLLPCLEAMSAGVIPVTCNDMTTRRELLPPDLFPEYSAVDPEPASVARFIAKYVNEPVAIAEMKDRLHTHYQTNWAHKLTGRAVAERIVEVARGIEK